MLIKSTFNSSFRRLIRILVLAGIGIWYFFRPAGRFALFSTDHNPYPDGHLVFTFSLNKMGETKPSYQTVIWLENQSDSIYTLLVSEWLCYSGFDDRRVCPDWLSRSNWGDKTLEEMDAVSAATPLIQPNTYTFSTRAARLLPGTYRYYIQTHIENDFNILADGVLTVGTEPSESYAAYTWNPDSNDFTQPALADVAVKYLPVSIEEASDD